MLFGDKPNDENSCYHQRMDVSWQCRARRFENCSLGIVDKSKATDREDLRAASALKGAAMATVSDLLNLPNFAGTQVIAGSTGLDATVEDISIMEVPDIEDYVGPGDFLLTTLYPLSDSLDALGHFVTRMKRAGLSGVGVKLNRYVSSLPASSLGVADELGLPILLLPTGANFSSMINDFLKESLQKKNSELEHRNRIHEIIMNILLSGGTPQTIAKTLAENLGRSVVLLDPSYEMLAFCSGGKEWKANVREVAENASMITFNVEVEYRRISNGFCALYGVRFGKKAIGVIAVCSPEEFRIEDHELITLQQFAIVFRISVQHQMMMEDAARNRRNSFALDFLGGIIGEDETAVNQASLLEWSLRYPLAIVSLVVPPTEKEAVSHHEMMAFLSKRVNQRMFGKSSDDSVFWAVNGASIVVLLSNPSDKDVRKVVGVLEEELGTLGSTEYYIAQSRNAESTVDVAAVYQECEYTLRLSQKLKNFGYTKFQNLGVYRIIYGSKNKEELRNFCQDTIGKVIEYDEMHSASLLQTVETVVECGGNLKAASEKLFVHYNTVRYRYRLAESLLGVCFDNPDEFQSVSLAVKVYRALPSV